MDKNCKGNTVLWDVALCVGIGIGVYLALRYLLFLLFPLGAAWILGYYLQGPMGFLTSRLKFPKGLAALFLLVVSLGAAGALVGFALVKLWQEADGLALAISQGAEAIKRLLNAAIVYAQNTWNVQGLEQTLSDVAMSVVETAAKSLPNRLGDLIGAIPQTVIATVVFLLSFFYFTRDFHAMNRKMLCMFCKRASRFLSEFKNQLLSTCANYAKAYLFLLLLSFTQLYLGLTLLQVEYAFSLAFIIALVDILPVLGMGVVVIPWALWCFLCSDFPLGGGLLLLYGVMSVVRQIAEPKIVGNFIGLHPLVSLISVCVGLRFLGVGGMFALPILVIVLKNMRENGYLLSGEGK